MTTGDAVAEGAARTVGPGEDQHRKHLDLVARDRERVWHPYAPMPSVSPAVPVVAAEGTTLHLADGRQAIDGMSSWWAAIHGHRHPVLDEAIRKQLEALTGGYLSMAATLCTAEVAAGVSAAESGALMHGPTFMGNPLAAAVSVASVRLLLSRPWAEEVASIAEALETALAPAATLAGVADVRVLGAIGVIETVDPVPAEATQELLLDRGVWLRPFGRLLYTMPPYISTAEDLRRITGAMVDAAEALS